MKDGAIHIETLNINLAPAFYGIKFSDFHEDNSPMNYGESIYFKIKKSAENIAMKMIEPETSPKGDVLDLFKRKDLFV